MPSAVVPRIAAPRLDGVFFLAGADFVVDLRVFVVGLDGFFVADFLAAGFLAAGFFAEDLREPPAFLAREVVDFDFELRG
jgi:hypothetical protein